MGKPRMTALAIAIKAAEPLSDEEKQTLRDILRPAPKPRSKSKPVSKPSQKRKATTVTNDSECKVEGCGIPLIADRHHNKQNPHYHEFQPASEASKGVGV